MNRRELLAYVATYAGTSRDVAALSIDGFGRALRWALADGGRVTVYGLGTFSARWRSARTVRSVHTKERVTARGRVVVHFKASQLCRARVERGWL